MSEPIVSFGTSQPRPGEARAAPVRRKSKAGTELQRRQAEAADATQCRKSDVAPAFSRRLTGLHVNECLQAVESSNG